MTNDKNIQKKFERIQKWYEGGVAFWSFGSHRSHVKENEKQKSWNIVNPKFQKKKSKTVLCVDNWEEISEKIWKDLKVIVGGTAF